MDIELDQYTSSNLKLDLAIQDLTLKLRAAEKEVANEREKVRMCANTVKRFRVDLNECVQNISEPKLLKVRAITSLGYIIDSIYRHHYENCIINIAKKH